MTHRQQLAPTAATRAPAGPPVRAKVFQAQQQQKQLAAEPKPQPRTCLALLGNDNTVTAPSLPTVKPAAPPTAVAITESAEAAEPTERPPPPASAYEAPFEWEFLPDTADWLSLLGRLGGGLPFGGAGLLGAFDDAERLNNKENVPPPTSASVSPSWPDEVGGADHYWVESPTRRPRRDDCDCVEICFDIGKIL